MNAETTHQRRLARAREMFRAGDDFLLDLAIDDMLDRLSTVNRSFQNAIALFGRTPKLAERLDQSDKVENVVRVEETVYLGQASAVASPDDLRLEANGADLIIVPYALHWAKDLPGALIQIAHALRPDGLLLASLPGPDTLIELRQSLLHAESETADGAAMRVDPFTDTQAAGALLQRCGYALPVVDTETLTIRYDSMFDLISDLRRFGAGSRSGNPPLKRETIRLASEMYAREFSDEDGRIRASFQIVSMSGWKPHESQQKPLKPGSAKARLADALKTDEVNLKP